MSDEERAVLIIVIMLAWEVGFGIWKEQRFRGGHEDTLLDKV